MQLNIWILSPICFRRSFQCICVWSLPFVTRISLIAQWHSVQAHRTKSDSSFIYYYAIRDAILTFNWMAELRVCTVENCGFCHHACSIKCWGKRFAPEWQKAILTLAQCAATSWMPHEWWNVFKLRCCGLIQFTRYWCWTRWRRIAGEWDWNEAKKRRRQRWRWIAAECIAMYQTCHQKQVLCSLSLYSMQEQCARNYMVALLPCICRIRFSATKKTFFVCLRQYIDLDRSHRPIGRQCERKDTTIKHVAIMRAAFFHACKPFWLCIWLC